MRKVKQSTAKNVMVLMVEDADHITGLAGLTLTITASKDGAAFGAIAPTVNDRGNGWYAVALTASHTDTLGDLALHITGAAADPVDMVLLVEGGSTDVDVSSRMATYAQPAGFLAATFPSVVASTTNISGGTITLVSAVAGLTASDIAAIKAKTDSLTYTVAGQLDVNVQSVNDVLLQGVGITGDSWRPA